MKKDIREKVWKKYNEKCAYCGNGLEYKDLEVDHIYPKHLGGTDDYENLNPSCKPCNFYKSTFVIDKFREQITTILDRVKKPFIVRLAIKYGLISFKPFDGLFYFEKHKKAFSLSGVGCSAISKDYTLLFDKISKGEIVPCFVDYYFSDIKTPQRDIAQIKMFKDQRIMIGVRGMQYGGVDDFALDGRTVLKAFTDECNRLNLEYYQ